MGMGGLFLASEGKNEVENEIGDDRDTPKISDKFMLCSSSYELGKQVCLHTSFYSLYLRKSFHLFLLSPSQYGSRVM